MSHREKITHVSTLPKFTVAHTGTLLETSLFSRNISVPARSVRERKGRNFGEMNLFLSVPRLFAVEFTGSGTRQYVVAVSLSKLAPKARMGRCNLLFTLNFRREED